MFDRLELRDEIEMVADHWIAAMPADVRGLLTLAKASLRDGPVYLDGDGEECSCFDDGAVAFDFSGAVERIGAYLDGVSDIEGEVDWDEETEEGIYEAVSGSADLIVSRIVGSDLAGYL